MLAIGSVLTRFSRRRIILFGCDDARRWCSCSSPLFLKWKTNHQSSVNSRYYYHHHHYDYRRSFVSLPKAKQKDHLEPGEIYIDDFTYQESVKINLDRLRSTVERIRPRLNKQAVQSDVRVMLVQEEWMRAFNKDREEYTNYPMSDFLASIVGCNYKIFSPQTMLQPELVIDGDTTTDDSDSEDYELDELFKKTSTKKDDDKKSKSKRKVKHEYLGDLVINVKGVVRECKEDQQLYKKQYPYEGDGVWHAWLNNYNPEQRIQMLVIHGMLHLCNYTHDAFDNKDEYEYNLMVKKEDELLQLLQLVPRRKTGRKRVTATRPTRLAL